MKYNKIAVISDLHANLCMLNSFLDYVEKKKIEVVINLGDFISEGPYPYEVAQKVLTDKRFINIRGYDEDKILENNLDKDDVGTLTWAREKLDLKILEKIKELPSIKSMEIGNIKILMMHLNGFAEISQKVAHSSRKIMSGECYEYIFCGGGHLQQLMHAKEPFFNTNIIEPGALMKDENDRGHFVVLDMNDHDKPKITYESIICKETYQGNGQIKNKEVPYLIEEVNLKEDICLRIFNNDDTKDEVFKKYIMKRILEVGFRESKYISIGCWENEKDKIKELLFYLKCRRIKTCEKSKQQWYMGEITPEIKQFVEIEVCECKGEMKWFEISFLENVYSIKPMYSIYHYGKECLVNRISSRELYNMEETLKKYKIFYETNI